MNAIVKVASLIVLAAVAGSTSLSLSATPTEEQGFDPTPTEESRRELGVSAAPSSTPTSEVLAAFHDVRARIAELPENVLGRSHRNGLVNKLDKAEAAYREGDLCGAAGVLGTYLRHTQDIRRGESLATAEELHNDGRMLRNDVLASLPHENVCPGSERFGMEPAVNISDSDNEHLAARITFGEPRMWSVAAGGEIFTQVDVPGLDFRVGDPGLPAVPVLRRLVAVPQGAEISIESSVPSIAEEIHVNLVPFQNQAADQEPPPDPFADPPFAEDEEAYAANQLFPPQLCSAVLVGQFRDLQMAQLSCAAGQYNPATDTLTLYDSVDFEAAFAGGSGAFVTEASLNPFESATSVYAGAVLNSSEVLEYVGPRPLETVCSGEELLILTPPAFRQAADDLAQWKRDKGISTNVFEVEGVTAEEIDGFIEQRYDQCTVRPSYVLLLGDAEFIPTFYVSTSYSAKTGSDYRYASYPQFSAGFIADIFPDFAVGRIPVDTLEQANAVVDKIIDYEARPPLDASFYNNVSIASQFQCCRWDVQLAAVPTKGWDQRGFIETSELARDELLNQGYAVERIYTTTVDFVYETTKMDPTPRRYYDGTLLPADLGPNSTSSPWTGSTQDVIDAFNDGRFLIVHRDHGSWDRWSHPEFTKDDVTTVLPTMQTSALTNDGLLPVVFSINCSSALFDNETNPGEVRPDPRYPPYPHAAANRNETYFAERLLRWENGGAIGLIGATRDSPTWANDSLTRGLIDAVWPTTVPGFGDGTPKRRLGDILNHAKVYLFTQGGIPERTETILGVELLSELSLFHVIGDPTLEMWTSQPAVEALLPDVTVATLDHALRVKYGVDGATITALQQTDNGVVPIGRAVVRDGSATLEFVVPPQPGVPVRLSASLRDAVSRLLTPKPLATHTPTQQPAPTAAPNPATTQTPTPTPSGVPMPTPTPTPIPTSTPTATPPTVPTPEPTPAQMEIEFTSATRNCPDASVTVEWSVTGDPSGSVEIWRWRPGDLVWVRIFSGSPGEGVGHLESFTDYPGNDIHWYRLTTRNSRGESVSSDPIQALNCIE